MSDNLRLNSEVLTDVLYANIFKLLGNKFNTDEFVDWVANLIVDSGGVVKECASEGERHDNEVVNQLDDSQLDYLRQKIYSAIDILTANRLNIFKLLSDVDNKIQEIGSTASNDNNVTDESNVDDLR